METIPQEAAPSTPPLPTPEPVQKSNTTYILIAILSAVAVGVGGFLFAKSLYQPKTNPTSYIEPSSVLSITPTPDPTANWKIYEDHLNGYSLKYPEEFEFSDYREGNFVGVSLNFDGPRQKGLETSLIDGVVFRTLVITESEDVKALAESGRNSDAEPQPLTSYPVVSEIVTTILDNKTAYTYTIIDSVGSLEFRIWYVPLDNATLKIWFFLASSEETKDDYLTKANQILSTLEILDDNLLSGECGVCGPKGSHNLEGRTCASGLHCTNSEKGIVTSVSFCVKPGESIQKCL